MILNYNDSNTNDEYPNFNWNEEAIVQRWGKSIVWYFRYLKFLIIYNVFLFILQWITLIPHFVNYFKNNVSLSHYINITQTDNWLEILTLSSYVKEDFDPWYVFSAFSIVAIFGMSLVYQYRSE